MRITGAHRKQKQLYRPFPDLVFGERATVTASYSHRDYSAPFDRGTIFDLNTGHAVNVDRKTRFDEAFNITYGYSDLAQLNAEYRLNDAWTARFYYSYSQDDDNQARVMAYDWATGTLPAGVDGNHGSTQKMHSTRADLQGNAGVGGFYNELLTGVAYENYDLLCNARLCLRTLKASTLHHPVYGTLDTCNTVSASDSYSERIQQESYAAYVQDALYLTDNWIAVACVRYQYYTQYAGKGRPFNVNTDSRDEKWTPVGLVYKVTPNVSLFANVAQSFMPNWLIASYIGELPPDS